MDWTPYLDRLLSLTFVSHAHIVESGDAAIEAVLEIETPSGCHRAFVERKSTNLSHASTAETIGFIKRRTPDASASWILFAPRIGPGIAERLRAHAIDYVDLAGNCYVSVGDQYVAHIEGRRLPKPKPGRRGIGAAGYRVLFALLATPTLLPLSVRFIAAHAGVNRQTVAEMIDRLVEDGIVVGGARRTWVEGKRRRALEQWLAGYTGTVRPKLWLGAYRSSDKSPGDLRARIAPRLHDLPITWRWGGECAGYLLNQHFQGARTVVHVAQEQLPSEFAQQLRVAPDEDGPLVVLGIPGPEALKSPHPETVHPLMIWSELMVSGNERAREAAEEPLRLETPTTDNLQMTDYASELTP